VKTHLPSLRALQTSDDEQLREELDLLAVREQVAVVRTFADELERLTSRESTRPLRTVRGGAARLGCRILEAAATAFLDGRPTTPADTRPFSQDREASLRAAGTPERVGAAGRRMPSREVFR